MDLDKKTNQIHAEIRTRLYEPLMRSMTRYPEHTNKAFSSPQFRSRNVMQFMDWLVNETKEVRLIGFHPPLLVTGKDASGNPITEKDPDYIEKRQHAMRAELIKISEEFKLTLDETREHISDFNIRTRAARKPMVKAQEA